jgi:hypothetical protein
MLSTALCRRKKARSTRAFSWLAETKSFRQRQASSLR